MTGKLITLLFLASLSSALAAEGQDLPELKIYDVKDMLAADDTCEDQSAADKLKAEQTERLAKVIRGFIQPSLKESMEDIKALGVGTIVANAREVQHQWINAFLKAQRAAETVFFLIELRCFSMPDEVFQEVMSDLRNGKAEIIEDPAQTRILIEKWKTIKNIAVVQAPKVLVKNREKAVISCISRISYIADYKVHVNVEPVKTTVVDPVIEIMDDGFMFDVESTLIQGDNICVDINVEHTEVQRPIPEIETEHGPLARPVLQKVALRSKFILKNNASLIYGVPSKEKGFKKFVHILKVKILTAEDIADQDLGE